MLLLPLQGLLSRLLKLLHVFTHSLQLLLDALQVLLSQLRPLEASLELRLLNSELPAELIKLLNSDFIIKTSVLNNLDSLEDLVSVLGGDCKLGDGLAEVVSRLLVLLLHEHDPPGQGGHIGLDLLVLLVSLLKGLVGLGQLVISLVIVHLEVLDLLAQVPDVAVSLVRPGRGLPGGLLKPSDGGVQPLCLPLEGLHLLANSVHV